MIRYLFLDIDGVLNSSRSFAASESTNVPYVFWAAKTADPIAVGLVNKLVDQLGLQIVLSSSHRQEFLTGEMHYDYDGPGGIERGVRTEVDLNALRVYMKAIGINSERIVGVTPDITYIGHIRGDDIKYYLDRHPCDEYVILDDSGHREFLPEQHPFFVKTIPEDGLSFENYLRVQDIFSAEIPKPHITLPASIVTGATNA